MQKQTFAGKQNNFTLIFLKFRIQQGDQCVSSFFSKTPALLINWSTALKSNKRWTSFHYKCNAECMVMKTNNCYCMERGFSAAKAHWNVTRKNVLVSFKKGTTSTTPIEFMCRVGFHEENCFLTSKKVSCEIFFRKAVDYHQLLFGEAL